MIEKDNHKQPPRSPTLRVWSASVPLLALLILAPVLSAAATLTASEQSSAAKLAAEIAWVPEANHSQVRRNLPHPLDVQTLSIERQEQKNTLARPLVRLYQYHYGTASARLLVFDLATSRLMRESPIPSVHLPLNAVEIEFATELVKMRNDIIKRLQSEQIRRGENPFSNLNDLDVKASIFEPMDASHPCAKERCALMSLFDKTRTVFTTEPVVRLQTQSVELLDRQ